MGCGHSRQRIQHTTGLRCEMSDQVKIIEVNQDGQTEKMESPCKKVKLQSTLTPTEIDQLMQKRRKALVGK